MTETSPHDSSKKLLPRRVFRTSIRELLLLTAFAAVAFASLKYAGEVIWTIAAWVALLGLMLLAVIAIVHRGPLQGFALGAVICGGVYAFIVLFVVDWRAEADEMSGKLPTTKASFIVYEAVRGAKWVDLRTGEELEENDPRVAARKRWLATQQQGASGMGGAGFGGSFVAGGMPFDARHCLKTFSGT